MTVDLYKYPIPLHYMPDLNNAGLSPATIESIAGLSAGTVATLTVHPLDVVKTRMQSMYMRFYPSFTECNI